jgi:hypothetical protein
MPAADKPDGQENTFILNVAIHWGTNLETEKCMSIIHQCN